MEDRPMDMGQQIAGRVMGSIGAVTNSKLNPRSDSVPEVPRKQEL